MPIASIRILKIDLSGVERHLERQNEILEAIARRMGAQVDPIPANPDEFKPSVGHSNPDKMIIEELVAKNKRWSPI